MSVFPEKRNGVPTGRFRVEVQIQGKKHVTYKDTKKLAKQAEAALKAGIIEEPAPKGYSMDDLRRDCRHMWEGGKDPQGLKRFEVACDVLKEALGTDLLRDIKLTHMDKFLKLILARPGVDSPVTANRYLSPISKALEWADDREHINRRPNLKKLWVPTPKRPKFSLSEQDEAKQRAALQEQRGDDLVLLMDVQIASAARISELLKLETANITHEGDRTILSLLDTKNGGYRDVGIPKDLGEPFEALVKVGLPSYKSIWRAMRFARKTVGLPTTQPTHAHRHTAATRMTKRGVNTATVKEFLGHASIATTMLYVEVDAEAKREASRVLLGR